MWAWCALLIVTRASYAAGDRTTPLRLSLWAVAVNLALTVSLVWPLGGTGLAFGTSLTAMIQAAAATHCVERTIGRLDRRGLIAAGVKSLLGTTFAIALAWAALRALPDGDGLAVRSARVAAPLMVAVGTYLAAAKALRADEAWALLRGRTRA